MSITRRDFIKALGVLVGGTITSQFDRRLESMARVLSGSQEWALTLDDRGLEKLCCERMNIESRRVEGKNIVAECSLDVSERDIWECAILTDPDSGQWHTVNGENWVSGDRIMRL